MRRSTSALIFIACGLWLIGLGLYFAFFRPALLPEDPRYIGRSLAEIRSALPGLEGWLGHVFRVMGGFMAAAGLLTAFLAATGVPGRVRGTGIALVLAGLSTVASMSGTNFAIDSDFKWFLLAPALLWTTGIGVYAAEGHRLGSPNAPMKTEKEAA